MEIQRLHELTQRIWYMDPTVETDRPALGYIRGDRFSVMVDAGNSPAHAALFMELLKEKGLPLPSYCLITHWHWDHTFGICGLDIPCVCSEKTAEYLDKAGKWSFAEGGEGRKQYDSDSCIRAEYADPLAIRIEVPEITFDREITFDLGGISAKMIFVGGPHSDDSAIVFIPEEKVIFAGDSSSGNFSLPNIAYVPELLDEHEAVLRSIPFETYLHAGDDQGRDLRLPGRRQEKGLLHLRLNGRPCRVS